MENLTKENVYVKVESKEQAEMYKTVLKSLKQAICIGFYEDESETNSMQESLVFKLGKFTVGNKPDSRKKVSFGQLIDIITRPEKIAVRVESEKEFKALMRFYDSKGWESYGNLKPLDFPYAYEFITFENGFYNGVLDELISTHKIIPFSDFAKEHNIKMPIITTVDGVDLFEGDNYFMAKCIQSTNNKWILTVFNAYMRIGSFAITDPDHCKAFSTKQAAENWIEEQNSVLKDKTESQSIRQLRQNAISILMAHADGDFVSKEEAKVAGIDLHNLMITLPDSFHSFILDDIIKEVNRAESKHLNWPTDKLYAVSIIAEEMGEVMKEAVKIQMNEPDASLDNLRKETIQTAATCIRLLKNL